MEKFGYKKGWKAHKFMECGYPVIALLGIAALGLFVVLPSRGQSFRSEFKWWVPLFAVALIVWAVIEIRKFRKALGYSVELTEDSIRVRGDQSRWEDVTRIEFKSGLGDAPAIIVHTKRGQALAIAGATDGIQYVKGFIEGHAKSAQRS